MKNLVVKPIVAGLLLFAVTSCGKSSGGSNDNAMKPRDPQFPSKDVSGETIYLSKLEVFDRFQKDCSGSAKEDFGLIEVTSYFQEASHVDFRPIPSLRSVGQLSSGAIQKVLVGQKLQAKGTLYIDSSKRISVQDLGEFNEVEAAKPLELCDFASLPRESLEAQALTTIAHIQSSADFVNGLGRDFEKVYLNLFPSREITFNIDLASDLTGPGTAIEYESDNATFSGKSGVPTITIYPRAKVDDEFLSERLWNSPFVMAHEYGHHLFGELALWSLDSDNRNSIMQRAHFHRKLSHFALKGIEVESDHKHHGNLLSKKTAFQASRATDSSDSWLTGVQSTLASLNEGFADLFGYYSNEQKEGLSTGLSGLQDSRNIESSKIGRDVKKLTSSRIYAVINQFAENEYSDPHLIGAIYAYGIDQLLNMESLEGDDLAQEKGKAIFAWAEAIGQQLVKVNNLTSFQLQSTDGEWFLKMGLHEFLRVIANDDPSTEEREYQLSKSQCQLVMETFGPLMTSRLETISFSGLDLSLTFNCVQP
ncbi:hypothetical protein [Pseudobacteriovorax antillogorgiicola]|uniref:Uncharacterized protein n=1 Tax=Pseudobacteriovorax antillogorgiicola TaxID=1513793 RepID=A0A1Y6BI13_9BACT|nr:hypothetical protein [Pseudobacteriovorax antillogorgiicola]TCS55426.1 hypothetical protein EDD56_105147 [Pseudobacteriovorax antillogorgiicola]SMF12554.1 hypothetical protein SAMN06296036_105177 [Pseudobacteriovorax antillogorgiicola]